MSIHVLQLCALTLDLERALAERFVVHRWFAAHDPDGFLTAYDDKIRTVITGGHLGIPNELAARVPALEIVAINGVGFDKANFASLKNPPSLGNATPGYTLPKLVSESEKCVTQSGESFRQLAV